MTTSPCTVEELTRTVRQLSAARRTGEVTGLVRSVARSWTGADGVTFVLRSGDESHYVDEDAIGPLWTGQRFPLRACISGRCILHGETVVIEDIRVDPRIPQEAYRATFVRALAMVPVRSEGERGAIGAIGIYWAERHRATAQELEMLQTLADASSMALAHVEARERSRHVEQRLDEERRLAEELVDSHPGVTYVLDAAGRMVRWNRTFLEITGLGDEEMRGRHALELIAPADREEIGRRIAEVFERGHATAEGRLSGADGREVPFLFTGRRVAWQGGEHLVGVGLDMSDLEKARAAERRLLEVIEVATDMIGTCDGEGRTLEINTATRKVIGIAAHEDVRGVPVARWHPD